MLPDALLIDFDGTLVDTEWAIYSAWLRTFHREGQDLPIEVYVQCIGSDFATWSPKTHLEELTGKTFDWEAKDEARQQEIVAELAEQGPVPGAREVLSLLAGQTRLAVVSSSSHDWVDGWLARLDLAKYFETTICRGDAPRIKPAPDLYLAGARALGMNPSQCLVLEDSLNGARSAKAAGMTAHVIPNRITRVSDFAEADGVFSDLTAWSRSLFSAEALR
ncbi:HAD family hydrolase [Roseibacillus ishigakijimensis]|uniref:HAD family phosphatase n=1 Tax=Roseibacillus ishigakijimensis TaxID=454146 RepID=A0A934RN76_9BACT|nr:HAD family phosphatase [Roseibacillus ishigakijimensis]MBK1834494.1 HAD family phosphatase [Roseibacillus ishigakijimensis]